jgi:hypothetical protein
MSFDESNFSKLLKQKMADVDATLSYPRTSRYREDRED